MTLSAASVPAAVAEAVAAPESGPGSWSGPGSLGSSRRSMEVASSRAEPPADEECPVPKLVPLLGDPPPGTCVSLGPGRCLRHELRWAYRESEHFMLHLVAKAGPLLLPCTGPRLRGVVAHGARSERCLIWYNPLWWLAVLACVLMMVAGRLWHSLFGQGRAIRPDEEELEKMVRVWWVYTYSGGFVATTLMDAFALASELLESPAAGRALGYTCSIVISMSYLLGNVNLVHQMARQETMLMHLSAVGKMTYGLAFVLVFAIGEVRGVRNKSSSVSALASLMRLTFAVFMLLSLCGYSRILKHRYPVKTRHEGSKRLQALFIVLFAVYPFALVLVLFFLGGDQVWEGLAGL